MAKKDSSRRGRYASPPPLPPHPEHLSIYLRAAQPDRPEEERVKANNQLLQLYRSQPRKCLVAFELRMFFDDTSRAIWLSENPVNALKLFLYGTPRRGAKKKNEYGNFVIASEVAELMRKGETRDRACETVAERARLSPSLITAYYSRIKKNDPAELCAEVALRALREIEEVRRVLTALIKFKAEIEVRRVLITLIEFKAKTPSAIENSKTGIEN